MAGLASHKCASGLGLGAEVDASFRRRRRKGNTGADQGPLCQLHKISLTNTFTC